MAQNIVLPEHNSSRLLFIEDPLVNSGSVEPVVTYNTCWLLGKLNNYIWLLEDVGPYDTNSEFTGKIYYIHPSTGEEVKLFDLTRAMEYAEDCDRMYTQYSGGSKMQLITSAEDIITSNFYIKYERNFPPCDEKLEIVNDNNDTNYYIYLLKYGPNNEYGISDIIGIAKTLNVTTDKTDANGNPILMEGINYLKPNIQYVGMDFSKLTVKYLLNENYSNDLKIGIIGVNTLNKKFISWHIKDKALEPLYFLVQPPVNRSWICFRTTYHTQPGNIDLSTTLNGYYSSKLTYEDSQLTGYFGTYDSVNSLYVYEYTVDRSKLPFHFMLPVVFKDYVSFECKDINDHRIYRNYEFKLYNELDGMYYDDYYFDNRSQIDKVILKYAADNFIPVISEDDDLEAVSILKVGDILAVNHSGSISIVDSGNNSENSLVIIHPEDYDNYRQSHNVTPLGVCVIPDNFISHDENNLDYFGRFVYINNLPWTYEAEYDLHTFDEFGGYNDETLDSLKIFNTLPCFNNKYVCEVNENIIRMSASVDGALPVDCGRFIDFSHENNHPEISSIYRCPTDTSTYYNYEISKVTPPHHYADFCPSPYKYKDGKYIFNRSQYAITEYEGEAVSNAFTDTIGILNTYEYEKVNKSRNAIIYGPVHDCLNIEILNNKNILYVPAIGEAGFIFPRFNVINNSLEIIGATLFGYYGYPNKGVSFVEYEEPVLYYCSTQTYAPIYPEGEVYQAYWSKTGFSTFDFTNGANCWIGGSVTLLPGLSWQEATRPFFMFDPSTMSFIQLTDNESHWHKLHI